MMEKRFRKGRKRFSAKGLLVIDVETEPVAKVIEIEHPTRTANRELRKNRRESVKKGTDPRLSSPMKPRIVRDDDEADGNEFRPGLNDISAHLIANLMANGMTQEFAAPLCGVPPGTLSYWLSVGRKRRQEIVDWWERARPMIDADDSDEEIVRKLGDCPTMIRHVTLINLVEKARAETHQALLLTVWDAAEGGDVPAAMWLLERMFSSIYGKQSRKPREDIDETPKALDEGARDPVQELQRRVLDYHKRKRATKNSR